jgi:hypothetical protein
MLPKSMIIKIVKYIELAKKNDAVRHFLLALRSLTYSSTSLTARSSDSASESSFTSESSAATSLALAS